MLPHVVNNDFREGLLKYNVSRLLCIVASLVVLAGAISGCATGAKAPGAVTDDLGRNVQIDTIPQRIISLSPSNTELVYALGLEDRLVGVTKFDNYPEAAQSKEKIGGYTDIDIEKVVSLKPDLVLASGIQHEAEVIPALEKLKLKVIGLDATTLTGALADVRLLGRITGTSGQAEKLASSLEDRIKAVREKVSGAASTKRPRVLFLVWHDPIWTAGGNTLDNDLLVIAGGTNIAAGLRGYQTISLEQVLAADPEVIIALTGHGDGKDDPFNWAMGEKRLADTSARKASLPRVYQVDADITARSSPRAVDGLEGLARLLHPELY